MKKNRWLENEILERQKAESARSEALKRRVETEESERRAISRELHDQVGQHLAAISMGVRAVGTSAGISSQPAVAQLQADLERLGKTVHDLALELRPTALDDAGLVAALTSYLDDFSKRTGVASALHHSGPLPEQIPVLRPDVAVLDVSMPESNGAQTARYLQRCCPEVRILALTVHEDRSYINELLQAGATGYVLKRAVATELLNAIRAVASGGVFVDPRVRACPLK